MEEEPDFIVQLFFSAEGREYLNRERGALPMKSPAPQELLHLRHVQAGDFVRFQGIPKVWAVQYRTWHLMTDETVLKLTLDGPIEEGD